MVRQWQNLFYGQRYSATVLNDAVDFVKLAEAMGAEGVRVATQEEFKEAFANALKSGHPVVIDCQIDLTIGWCQFMLCWCNFVVLCLCTDTQTPQCLI